MIEENDKTTLNGEDSENMEHHGEQMDESESKKTSSGMEENVAGLLCYLAGFITGIIFLFIEKENQFIRFHAMQSIALSVVMIVISIVLSFIPVIGWIVALFLPLAYLVLWIFMMWKAYQGEMYKLPVLGDFSEKQINQMK